MNDPNRGFAGVPQVAGPGAAFGPGAAQGVHVQNPNLLLLEAQAAQAHPQQLRPAFVSSVSAAGSAAGGGQDQGAALGVGEHMMSLLPQRQAAPSQAIMVRCDHIWHLREWHMCSAQSLLVSHLV